jgi:hypothetical protein
VLYNIVFMQTDYDINDYGLDKKGNQLLWDDLETLEGLEKVWNWILQWDMGNESLVDPYDEDDPFKVMGRDDEWDKAEMDDGTYYLTWNRGLGTIGLMFKEKEKEV